jgi:outer membrane biosynthesis protein TonB
MRHYQILTTLLIACVVSLSACAQSASVGIPTPERIVQNQSTPEPTANAAAPVATIEPTSPAPTPAPAATPQPQKPAPAATPQPPEPTQTAPAPTEPAPTVAPDTSSDNFVCNQMVTHIVKPGENLFRIGLHYKTTAYAIARRNGIPNVRIVRAGTQLRILTCG